MDSRRSIYPGGPRSESAPALSGAVEKSQRPLGGEDAEARRERSYVRGRRSKRRRRALIGLGLILAAGASLGTLVGLKPTESEVRFAQPEPAEQSVAEMLAQERGKIVRELWAMEELERSGRE